MKFLLPVGGVVDPRFGILTTPSHNGVALGIKDGMIWAADNEAFTQGFNPAKYFPWLDRMRQYRDTCLFVSVPDVVGNPIETLDNWRHWIRHFDGWPLALVAQDGQENLPMPKNFDTLFIGGNTEWKEGAGAIECIKRAQEMRKHIHVGRVNSWRRFRHFHRMPGAEVWTCDGTHNRFVGVDNAIKKYDRWMAQRPLITI